MARPAHRLYEEPPTEPMVVETPWGDLWLGAGEWAEAFDSPAPGTPHNEARDEVWETLLDILVDRHDDDDVPPDLVRPTDEARPPWRAAVGSMQVACVAS